MEYIEKKLYGLPKPQRKSWNTSKTRKTPCFHVYPFETKTGHKYFRVQFHRGGKHITKYFKTQKAAMIFRDSLLENPYI